MDSNMSCVCTRIPNQNTKTPPWTAEHASCGQNETKSKENVKIAISTDNARNIIPSSIHQVIENMRYTANISIESNKNASALSHLMRVIRIIVKIQYCQWQKLCDWMINWIIAIWLILEQFRDSTIGLLFVSMVKFLKGLQISQRSGEY